MGSFFWFLYQHVRWHLEKLLIFVCWFYLFIRSRSLFMNSLETFKYRIILSAEKDNLTSSFRYICISFFFLPISVAKNSSSILNKSRKTTLSHSWLQGNAFSFSPIQNNVGYKLVIYSCYYIEVHYVPSFYIFSIPSF
jgi:hypothetical protein